MLSYARLRGSGLAAEEMQVFDPQRLRGSGVAAQKSEGMLTSVQMSGPGISTREIHVLFTPRQLRGSGVIAQELKDSVVPVQLRGLGLASREMKGKAVPQQPKGPGITAEELRGTPLPGSWSPEAAGPPPRPGQAQRLVRRCPSGRSAARLQVQPLEADDASQGELSRAAVQALGQPAPAEDHEAQAGSRAWRLC